MLVCRSRCRRRRSRSRSRSYCCCYIQMWKGLMVIESVLSAFFFHQQLALDSACVHRNFPPFLLLILLLLLSFSCLVWIVLLAFVSFLFTPFIFHILIFILTFHIWPRRKYMCSGTLHESTQYIIIETMTVHYLYHLHRLTVWQSVAIRVQKWRRNKSCVSLFCF